MNVQDYLKQHGKPFELLQHPETFDAQHMAAAVHVPGCKVGKTVVLRLDHGFRFAVALLPATHQVDVKRVSQMLGGAAVELATESQLAEHCPDSELGAVPPFGTMHRMLTLVDKSLSCCDEITFEGNRHSEAIRMKWQDFVDLEHPLIGEFGVPHA